MQVNYRPSPKKSFLICYRGPDFTQPFCEQHFSDLEINRVNARTVDPTGTKMAYLNHGRQLRVKRWISAVEEYNRKAPAHLKIHWAGATEAEHIRVNKRGRRLNTTTAYKDIMQGGNTYMEWSTASLCGKAPLRDLQSSPSSAFERVPKRTHDGGSRAGGVQAPATGGV